jgi:hypothetical protein
MEIKEYEKRMAILDTNKKNAEIWLKYGKLTKDEFDILINEIDKKRYSLVKSQIPF